MSYVAPVLFSGIPGNAGAIGHQWRNWLTGYKIAKHYNLTFAHVPFAGKHTQIQIDVPVEQWENFLNFGKEEIHRRDLNNIEVIKLPRKQWDQARVDHPHIAEIIEKNKGRNVLFECPDNQFMPINWEIFKTNRFKRKFWYHLGSTIKKYGINYNFSSNYQKLSVAIHIRRGDVTPKSYPDRFLSNQYYYNVIKQLSDIFGGDKLETHIYSEGNIDDFGELQEFSNIKFYLNHNVFETFYNLVSSDIFITGIGSFSILAAHLHNGLIITKPWNIYWQNFPEAYLNLIPSNTNGNFDHNRIKKAAKEILSW